MLEAAFIVRVTLFEVPVAGTLPVPVQPVVRYWVPVPPETGELTDSASEDPALNHPLTGVGVSWVEETVRKYW